MNKHELREEFENETDLIVGYIGNNTAYINWLEEKLTSQSTPQSSVSDDMLTIPDMELADKYPYRKVKKNLDSLRNAHALGQREGYLDALKDLRDKLTAVKKVSQPSFEDIISNVLHISEETGYMETKPQHPEPLEESETSAEVKGGVTYEQLEHEYKEVTPRKRQGIYGFSHFLVDKINQLSTPTKEQD